MYSLKDIEISNINLKNSITNNSSNIKMVLVLRNNSNKVIKKVKLKELIKIKFCFGKYRICSESKVDMYVEIRDSGITTIETDTELMEKIEKLILKKDKERREKNGK